MATLPPYSTFRTDSKQMMFPQATSHGNILTFTPPGFKQQLNVKFPDSRLAVCAKCKKNFKTRDMCRVRNTHTTAPWTTAYICITVDESCLDENGKYTDKPMTVRMVQWQPFCVKRPFDSKTPVCAACKRTNRTRSFCRERHKHRQLPWCTVYVLLSALDAADPHTVVAGASKKLDSEQDRDGDTENANNNRPEGESPVASGSSPGEETKIKTEDTASTTGSETIASDSGDPGDDINDIADSRTFLAKVSCRSTSVHWLEMAEYEVNEGSAYPVPPPDAPPQYHMMGHMPPHHYDPNQPPPPHQYYQPHMGYAAQQQQNALKSRQQYFFQIQQQQQHHGNPHSPYPPPPPPPPPPPHVQHWGPPHPHYGSPHMGPPPPGDGGGQGATAGDAAARHRGENGESDQTGDNQSPNGQQHSQQNFPSQQLAPPGYPPHYPWMMHYHPPPGYPPMPHENGQGVHPQHMHPYHPGAPPPMEGHQMGSEEPEQYHSPPEDNTQDDSDEQDSKRQRVV